MNLTSRRRFMLAIPAGLVACATSPTHQPRLPTLTSNRTVIIDATVLPLGIDYGTEGFLHARHYNADFGAVWDPNADAAEKLTKLCQAIGMQASPISRWTTPGQRAAWTQQARSQLRLNEQGTNGWNQAFSMAFTEKVRHLHTEGAKGDLLVELFIARISSMDAVAAPARLACTAFMRITDMMTGAVTFTGKYWAFEDIKLNGADLKTAIERDNLKLLKDFIGSVLQMAPRIYYSPVEGAFTQAFSTQMPQYW